MSRNLFDKIHQINNLVAETDAIYHQASVKLGISDSSMHVLYAIYDNGQSCLLSHIYKSTGISKQTVNSALRKLEDENIIYLEKYKGKSKVVRLTQKGEQYISKTAGVLYDAEQRAIESWSDDEINTHIMLLEKYAKSLGEQISKL